MPKRRLPGASSEGNDSSLHQHNGTQREAGAQHQEAPTGSRSSRKKISDSFSKLANGCNKHSAFHQNKKSSARQEEDEDNIPEPCRKDLTTMKVLLPKLEKSFQASNASQVEASDVAHLCEFYERTLRGVYCPHSPALFKWGKVPNYGKKKLFNVCCFFYTFFI